MNTKELLQKSIENLREGNDLEAYENIEMAKKYDIDDIFDELSNVLYNNLLTENEQVARKFKNTCEKFKSKPTKDSENIKANNIITNDSVFRKNGKNLWVAMALAFFLGIFGAHRFYDGRTKSAIAMLLITVLSFGTLSFVSYMWAVVDFIIYLTKISEYVKVQ